MCNVIFTSQGITSQMAPSEAVEKNDKLPISTTENGVYDNKSLLNSNQLLDRIITGKKI